ARIESEDARLASRSKFSNLYAQGGVGGNDSNISYGGNGISRMAPGKGSPSAGITESSTSTYGVPFTIGLGARFNVAPKLSLGTGLEYSLLTRTFTGSYSDSYTGSIAHNVQYVGIPVNVYYDLFSTRDNLLNLYAWGGGSAEVCVANSYKLLGSESAPTIKDNAGSMQFSAALGLGFQFKLSDKLGLYVDPAVRYYFHGNQPKSIRTDKPLMFNMEAGLRFNL
ncbi:MAG: outer membrane beta-barrel protein, partial [Bacteroidales bacterium]|nr:outer membrane beta-barrel protein [Bacteroidales bacterium]